MMIVDDNMTNLIMAKKALEDEYEILPVSSGQTALEFLHDMPEPPDLILLDVEMPEVNGFHVISEIKNDPSLSGIPVIFLTAQDDPTTEVEGYFLGAVDYIKKPYSTVLLRKRLDVHIRLLESERRLTRVNETLQKALSNKIHNIVELEYAIVEMFVSLMGNRSHLIAEHSMRVEKYMHIYLDALIRVGQFDLKKEDAEILLFASKMHDIGKICMTDRCLADMGDLSLAEKEFNHAHTVLGAEAVKKVMNVVSHNNFLLYAYNMCRYHHERWDGKGYPDNLMTTDIPIEARILAIVNSYDDFRHQNDGAKPLTHTEAVNRIRLWGGTHFDPDLVDVFLSIEREIERIAY